MAGSVWVGRVVLVVLVEDEVRVEEEIVLVVLVVVGACRGYRASADVPTNTFLRSSMVVTFVLFFCSGEP